MISPISLLPPQPNTTRGSSASISYDAVNDRIAYASGKSIIVRSLDEKSDPIQFTKHTVTTTVAAFSPSGNYVASADEAGNVKIWDSSLLGDKEPFQQPTIKSEFQVLSGPIKLLAWDADNLRIIAVGLGKDKFGHCFTWDSGNSIGEIQGHSETVNAVAIKPQRPYRAATVGVDKALIFYTGPPFKFDKSVRGHHSNTIRDVKFSPNGKYLVSVGADRAIVLYDGKTGEYVDKIDDAHDGGIFGVSWFADSSAFVTASADNTLKSWNPSTLESKHIFTVSGTPEVATQQVGVVVAKEHVISLSLNGHLNIFKLDGQKPDVVIYGNQGSLTAVDNDDTSVVVGGADGTLIEYELRAQNVEAKARIFGSHDNVVVSILTEKNAKYTVGWDDKIKLWSAGRLVKEAPLPGQPKGLQQSGDLVIVLLEDKIIAFDAELTIVLELGLKFKASAVSSLPGTSKILVTNETGLRVEEFDLGESFTLVKSYPALRTAPTLVKVSPDGRHVAVAEATGKYTLYDTASASAVTTRWAFHNSRVNGAAWTPDSKFLISGGLDCGLFLYSVDRPAKVLKFPLAHQTGISGLAWTSYENGKGTFASTGLDGAVKTWSVDFSAY